MTSEDAPDGASWRWWAHAGSTRGPRWFVRWSPPMIGLMFCGLLPAARDIVVRNQRRMFGERDGLIEDREVAMTFAEYAACLSESLGAGRPEARLNKPVVEGVERALPLLESKKGLMLLTAHAGPWDAAAQALSGVAKKDVLLVMHAERAGAGGGLQDTVRNEAGISVVRLGDDPLAALPVLQHLQNGGIVALQLDRAPLGRPAVAGMLFGRPFAVPSGPFVLAGIADVPILPVFSARTGFFRRVIRIGQPLSPVRRPTVTQLKEQAQLALQQMEEHLLKYPRQWFHFVSESEEAASLEAVRESEKQNRRRLRSRAQRPAQQGP